MRSPWNAVLPILLLSAAFAADRPWQQLQTPAATEVASKFRTPPPEYGMVLWWGWDGPVTEEVIIRDLDQIKAMGFPAVMIEAGYGMTAKYLSPEWFELVRVAVDHARRRGMRVWVEDEGKYPSGFAGGK
ncbi:MAG: beta-galactosidase, partial [Acidobacteria bacterium]|nr:beta-galactosidase [Acidobacteriota bacterium]